MAGLAEHFRVAGPTGSGSHAALRMGMQPSRRMRHRHTPVAVSTVAIVMASPTRRPIGKRHPSMCSNPHRVLVIRWPGLAVALLTEIRGMAKATSIGRSFRSIGVTRIPLSTM
ncbi:MAG: hypothetical protein ACUVX8_11795 [Candidatus Zipacnadales bacterium]